MQNTTQQLQALRQHLQSQQLDYYLIPSTDPHQSEYVPDCWQRRTWISGFTGSAGLALVGTKEARLWTDARYFLQAETELDANWTLMRQAPGLDPKLSDWLLSQQQPLRVGVDPQLITLHEYTTLQAALASHNGELILHEDNLIDKVWNEQPPIPNHPAVLHPLEFAGVETGDKLALLRKKMRAKNVQALVINRLDSIAWLLNIRGQDIQYNPLCISYLIVTLDTQWWFIEPNKMTPEVAAYAQTHGIIIKPYDTFTTTLASLTQTVWIDPESSSIATFNALQNVDVHQAPCPVYAAKATKNSTEISGMRQAHIEDGLALCEFFYWLENERPEQVTEISAAKRLLAARQQQPHFQGESFAPISSYGPHGAIIHYSPTTETDCAIEEDNLYLLDSGGQYLCGTTDVTRCVHLGNPSATLRKHYTLVLKAHLALRRAVFPVNTYGEQLDTITRQPLWQAGLDFAHGTGHGVGCYLCVHEGPQRISPLHSQIPLTRGMVVSNEPGFYLDGSYGIRIENLCLITPSAIHDPDFEQNQDMLSLADLTLFPYEKKLLDIDLLTQQEQQAINAYHTMVYHRLSPHINDNKVKAWLAEKTNPITATPCSQKTLTGS